MNSTKRADRNSTRGGALVLAVVLLLGLITIPALVIDLGYLYTARGEAQRAADAAALAGVSAFLDHTPAEVDPFARERALDFTGANHIRNALIQDEEVTVEVLPDERKVRVAIRRTGLPTFFARFFGITEMPVSAKAAAVASAAGSARCLKPFAVPDLWHDVGDDTNGNRLWDEGEEWVYAPDEGDVYKPFSGPGGEPDETGYGSAWRNATGVENDYGRRIALKHTDPNSEFTPQPGLYLPFRLPEDEDMESCATGGGGGTTGAATYRQNICSCNQSSIVLGEEYEVEPGNMVGPSYQGVQDLIQQDPNARWDPFANNGKGAVTGSDWGDNWMQSPRVVKIAVMAPGQLLDPGLQTITFNNFGLLFIEEQKTMHDPIVGNFLFYVSGDDGGGPDLGSLTMIFRLVE